MNYLSLINEITLFCKKVIIYYIILDEITETHVSLNFKFTFPEVLPQCKKLMYCSLYQHPLQVRVFWAQKQVQSYTFLEKKSRHFISFSRKSRSLSFIRLRVGVIHTGCDSSF